MLHVCRCSLDTIRAGAARSEVEDVLHKFEVCVCRVVVRNARQYNRLLNGMVGLSSNLPAMFSTSANSTDAVYCCDARM
jgi:hypothetical protein